MATKQGEVVRNEYGPIVAVPPTTAPSIADLADSSLPNVPKGPRRRKPSKLRQVLDTPAFREADEGTQVQYLRKHHQEFGDHSDDTIRQYLQKNIARPFEKTPEQKQAAVEHLVAGGVRGIEDQRLPDHPVTRAMDRLGSSVDATFNAAAGGLLTGTSVFPRVGRGLMGALTSPEATPAPVPVGTKAPAAPPQEVPPVVAPPAPRTEMPKGGWNRPSVKRRSEEVAAEVAGAGTDAAKMIHAMHMAESDYDPKHFKGPELKDGTYAIGPSQMRQAAFDEVGGGDINDVHNNLRNGALYLLKQYKRFGNWQKALAAYNAGGSAVVEYGGVPPYKETQEYVKKILAYVDKNLGGLTGDKKQPPPAAPEAAPEPTQEEPKDWRGRLAEAIRGATPEDTFVPTMVPEEYKGTPQKHGTSQLGPFPGTRAYEQSNLPVEERDKVPTASQWLQLATYPLREKIAETARTLGTSDPKTTQGAVASYMEGALEMSAEWFEREGDKKLNDPTLDFSNLPAGPKRFLMELNRDLIAGASGFVPYVRAIKAWHLLLSATKVRGIGVLTLASFEAMRAAGADEPAYEAAVHGLVLQLGLTGAGLMPKAAGTITGAGIFGIEPFQAALAGELPWSQAWTQALIGGYLGYQGTAFMSKQRIRDFMEKGGVKYATVEDTLNALDAMRPNAPGGAEPAPAGQQGRPGGPASEPPVDVKSTPVLPKPEPPPAPAPPPEPPVVVAPKPEPPPAPAPREIDITQPAMIEAHVHYAGSGDTSRPFKRKSAAKAHATRRGMDPAKYAIKPKGDGFVVVERVDRGGSLAVGNRAEAEALGVEDLYDDYVKLVAEDAAAAEPPAPDVSAPAEDAQEPNAVETFAKWGPTEVAQEDLNTPERWLPERMKVRNINATIARDADGNIITHEIALPGVGNITVAMGIGDLNGSVQSHLLSGQRMVPNPEYPEDFQIRDNVTSDTDAQFIHKAVEEINETRLFKVSATNQDGPQVIDILTAAVVGGNTRHEIFRQMEELHPGWIREAMTRWEGPLGFPPGTGQRYEFPVPYLFQLTGRPQSAGEAKQLSANLNAASSKSMSSGEKAKAAAARIGPQTIEVLNATLDRLGSDATLQAVLTENANLIDALVTERVIPQGEMKALVLSHRTSNGLVYDDLTPQGKTEMRDAIIAHILPKAGLVERLEHHADLRNRIANAAPAILMAQRLAPNFLNPLIEKAVEAELARKGVKESQRPNPNTYIDQSGFTGGGFGEGNPLVGEDDAILVYRALVIDKHQRAVGKFRSFAKQLSDADVGASELPGFRESAAGDPRVAFNNAFGGANDAPERLGSVDPEAGEVEYLPNLERIIDPLGRNDLPADLLAVAERVADVVVRLTQNDPYELPEMFRETLEHEMARREVGQEIEPFLEAKKSEPDRQEMDWFHRAVVEGPDRLLERLLRMESLIQQGSALDEAFQLSFAPAQVASELLAQRGLPGMVLPEPLMAKIEPKGRGGAWKGQRDFDMQDPNSPVPDYVLKRGDVLAPVLELYGWTINFGRMNLHGARLGGSVLGVYETGTKRIKVKNWMDLQTSFHELGHMILENWPNLKEVMMPEYMYDPEVLDNIYTVDLPPLQREMVELSYEVTMPKEGFSEAIRLYFSQRGHLEAEAPHMKAQIDEFFASLPANEVKAWKEVEKRSHDYWNQGGKNSWLGQQGKENVDTVGAFETAFDKFRSKMVDGFHGDAMLEIETTGELSDYGIFFGARQLKGMSWLANRLIYDGFPVWDSMTQGVTFEGPGMIDIINTDGASTSRSTLNDTLYYNDARRAWSLGRVDRVLHIEVKSLHNPNEVRKGKDPVYSSEQYTVLVPGGRSDMEQIEYLFKREGIELEFDASHGSRDAIDPTPDEPDAWGYDKEVVDRKSGKRYPWEQYEEIGRLAREIALIGGATAQEAVEAAKRAQGKLAKGAEMGLTEMQIKQGLALETPARRKVFDGFVRHMDGVMQFVEDLGLVNRQQRDMWPWMDYAISFAREPEGPSVKQRGGRSVDAMGVGKVTHRARGSYRNTKEPLIRMFETPARLIQAAMENRINQKRAQLINSEGGGIFGGRIREDSEKWEVKVADLRADIMRKMKRRADLAGVEMPEDFMEHELMPDFLMLFKPSTNPKDYNTMVVMHRGKPSYYEVTAPLLLNAVAHMHEKPMGTWIKLGNLMRVFKQTSVTRHIDFVASQLARDPLHNWMFSRVSKRWLRTTYQGFKEAIRYAATNKGDIALESIHNLGGGGLISDTSFMPGRTMFELGPGGDVGKAPILSRVVNAITQSDSDYRRSRAIVRYGQRQRNEVMGYAPVLYNPADWLRLWDKIVMVTEMGPRLGEGIRAKEAGYTGLALGKYYREAGVDFPQHGTNEVMGVLLKIIPFLRSQISGMDRFYRGVGMGHAIESLANRVEGARSKEIPPTVPMAEGEEGPPAGDFGGRSRPNPAAEGPPAGRAWGFKNPVYDADARSRTVGRMVMMTLAAQALLLINRDIPDYQNEDRFRKLFYWHFYIPKGRDAKGVMQYDHYMAPKPYDAGMFATVSEQFLENLLESEDPEAFGHGMAIMMMLENQFGIGLPPALANIAQIWGNKNTFTGTPIVPQGSLSLPPWQQTRTDTSRTMAKIGEMTRKWPELLQVNPAQAEAGLQAWITQFTPTILHTLDRVFFPDTYIPQRADEAGFTRRFVGPPTGIRTAASRDFYDHLRWARSADDSWQKMQRDRRSDLAEGFRGSLKGVMKQRLRGLEALSDRVANVNAQIQRIGKGTRGPMSPDWRRDERTRLLRKRENLFQKGVTSSEKARRKWREAQ